MSKGFKKLTLPNSLRVILAPRQEAIAANVLVMAAVGSKYEAKELNGLSHFLEHMCFKGTAKRPTALEIASQIDALGAQSNAFTSQEYTGYHMTVEPSKLLPAIELLADMYLNPLFPTTEIEKEKGVIIEEINMYEDMPQRDVQDIFMSLVYGDQPVGRPILGTPKTVRSFGREHFQTYHQRHYTAVKTVVAVSGKFNERAVLRALKEHFTALRPSARPASKLKVHERQDAPQSVLKFKESDQAHLVLGFRSAPIGHRDYYPLEVLAAVLGGGFSSRLFQRIREEMGAAYYVYASQESYTDHGLFTVSVGAETKRTIQVIEAVLEECRRLAGGLVPPAELKRAKQSLVSQLFLRLEKASSLSGFYGYYELITGQPQSPTAIANALRAVTAADLQKVARKIFQNQGLNLSLVGPFKRAEPFVKVLTI